MNLADATIALDGLTKEFEARFLDVVNWSQEQPYPGYAKPNKTLPYLIYHNGIQKDEGSPSPKGGTGTEFVAVLADFRKRVMGWRIEPPTATLYWRVKPEWDVNGKLVRIYCRMVWA